MGFDNECILNIQSLPGEYFCPVCRTLIFPNEALQSQCTHLYCKPCLAYIVATTHACPYDGYLVTEADSKPLLESNKSLAETIGKVQVYCLYHRSGCQWQGTLSDCINHCAGCGFGNSHVVCNRCGAQIVHRQVQEHAQTCLGLHPQGQQVESSQGHVLFASNQGVTQDSSAATVASTKTSSAVVVTSQSVSAPFAKFVQIQNQPLTVAFPQLQYQRYGQNLQQTYPQYPQAHIKIAPQQIMQGQHIPQRQPQPHTVPQAHSQAQGTILQP